MNQTRIHIVFLFSMMITLMIFLGGKDVFAENIDPYDDGSQYAYGENVGWFNAEPLGDGGPGVEVEDSKLTGYIWAENIGWVSLSCENTSSCGTVNYGVTNDGGGNLSGYAWGENVGWISFSCENTSSCGTVDYGVIIDPVTGEFSGQAWGENIGWTTFRSTGSVPFGVTTSWMASVDPPVIDDITFDQCVSELCTSAISVTAHDPEGGALTYKWEALNGGDITGEGSDVMFDPPDTGPHPCPYQVEVTVTSGVSGLYTSETIDIYVKLAGDVDGTGVVNVLDKVEVRNHFGESGDPGWIDADVNCDGVVNVVDKVMVRNQFGETGCSCPLFP